MGRLLRCSVASGLAGVLLAAQAANAGEQLSAYSARALEKLAGKNVIVRDRPQLIVTTPAVDGGQQALFLSCEKIEQAQRSLNEALKNGAALTPAAPAISGKEFEGTTAAPASGAEVYHIRQNQRRMDALSQKFNCDAR